MKTFIEQARFYATFHQKPMTLYTHLMGIPLIIFALMVLLGFVKIVIPGIYQASFASLTTLILMIYYFRLQWKLALALAPVMIILLWLASWFSYFGPTRMGLWVFAVTFILGWAIQFIGHFIEGRRPAFMVNLSQSLVAPLYLVAELFFMAGYLLPLKAEIEAELFTEAQPLLE